MYTRPSVTISYYPIVLCIVCFDLFDFTQLLAAIIC